MDSTFRSLAEDTSSALPYDKDTAYERGRYGDGLLRKAPDQIYKQEEYENEVTARVEEVKRIRAEEQANIKAAEVSSLNSFFPLLSLPVSYTPCSPLPLLFPFSLSLFFLLPLTLSSLSRSAQRRS